MKEKRKKSLLQVKSPVQLKSDLAVKSILEFLPLLYTKQRVRHKLLDKFQSRQKPAAPLELTCMELRDHPVLFRQAESFPCMATDSHNAQSSQWTKKKNIVFNGIEKRDGKPSDSHSPNYFFKKTLKFFPLKT